MPVYQIGDLVQVKEADDDSIGFIIEMRAEYQPEARVLWSDMPDPRWIHLSCLALVQPARERGITGS